MKSISFYIASRYLLSKKGSTAVTFITWLAVAAMGVAVMAMFIIISVFSGLEVFNKTLISNLHADLTIKPTKGKTLPNFVEIRKTLSRNKNIAHFSRVIEEKIYLNYLEKGDIAILRGVDSAYTKVNPIDNSIFYGKYPDFTYSNEVAMEYALNSRLSIPINTTNDFALLYMPKSGTGIISKEEDIYNKKEILVTGVFMGNEQLNNYIISPIELSEELLDLPKNSAYQIVIKLKKPENANIVKQELLTALGKNIEIKTKEEENAAFWKMINTEKLFIYFIFALVIFITTFNLAGAIIILQLDKKEQSKSLISIGLQTRQLRKIYFYTGLLIVSLGVFSGLVLGSALCLFQMYTGFFQAMESIPFPIKILTKNYFIVSGIALFFGGLISWFFSKISKDNHSTI